MLNRLQSYFLGIIVTLILIRTFLLFLPLSKVSATFVVNGTLIDTITALSTLAAVLVAMFWSSFIKMLVRPSLDLEFDNTEPFCRHTGGLQNITTGQVQQRNSYHVRLRIKNTGRTIARKCEGKLIAIAHSDLRSIRQDFDPVILNWVGSDTIVKHLGMGSNPDKDSIEISKNSKVDINAKEFEYLDFLSTSDSHDRFEVQAIDYDIPRGIVLNPSRDNYFFLVTIYAENANPKSIVYKLIMGTSYDDFIITEANSSEIKSFYKLIK